VKTRAITAGFRANESDYLLLIKKKRGLTEGYFIRHKVDLLARLTN